MAMTPFREFKLTNRKVLAALFAASTALVALGTAASAEPQGYIEGDTPIGFFYGTFNQSPNVLLLAGGTVEQFCEANPDAPSYAEPGIAPARTFLRSDGSVDVKVSDKDQPIHLYNIELNDAPPWLEQVCAGYFDGVAAPQPFASGTADLKVRISVVTENLVDVFNSVNGKATGIDGSEYKVRAWADLIVENGMPVGDPEDFVGFELKKIRS